MAHQEYRGGDWVVVADLEDLTQTVADKKAAKIDAQRQAVAALQLAQTQAAAQVAAAQAELDALNASDAAVVAAESAPVVGIVAKPYYAQ